jgi:hypothetical protein
LSRLIQLPQQVRITRFRNYIRAAIGTDPSRHWNNESKRLISKLESSFRALVSIVETMADEQDRVICYYLQK